MLKDLHKLIVCGNDESDTIVHQLAAKYNCSVEKIYWQVRAIYGSKLRELRWEFREPSKEDFKRAVFMSKDKAQLKQRYPTICTRQWKGIYDRMLGVSTFFSAKEKALIEMTPTIYHPATDNNMAMWAAFRLGDGSYCKKRNAWKIEHCAKQVTWLEKKVELFSLSFPQASTKITHNEKRDTYSWYSRKIEGSKYRRLGSCNKVECVQHLNPFGIYILFMDDGHNMKTQYGVTFAVSSMSIANVLKDKLKTFGFDFRVSNKYEIRMTGIEDVFRFHKTFTEPFSKHTPEAMRYKHFMKI